jgi:hypothetical protein
VSLVVDTHARADLAVFIFRQDTRDNPCRMSDAPTNVRLRSLCSRHFRAISFGCDWRKECKQLSH